MPRYREYVDYVENRRLFTGNIFKTNLNTDSLTSLSIDREKSKIYETYGDEWDIVNKIAFKIVGDKLFFIYDRYETLNEYIERTGLNPSRDVYDHVSAFLSTDESCGNLKENEEELV